VIREIYEEKKKEKRIIILYYLNYTLNYNLHHKLLKYTISILNYNQFYTLHSIINSAINLVENQILGCKV